jgi:predicted nucleic acid-binding protein
MGAILLDTTVLIDLLRGRSGAVARLRSVRGSGDQPYVCAINVEELERGVRDAEVDALARLLDGLSVATLGRDEGTRAGRWRREHAAHGITLSQGDCLIASAAVGIGARLATGNPKDFPMPDLVVEHWPVGA